MSSCAEHAMSGRSGSACNTVRSAARFGILSPRSGVRVDSTAGHDTVRCSHPGGSMSV